MLRRTEIAKRFCNMLIWNNLQFLLFIIMCFFIVSFKLKIRKLMHFSPAETKIRKWQKFNHNCISFAKVNCIIWDLRTGKGEKKWSILFRKKGKNPQKAMLIFAFAGLFIGFLECEHGIVIGFSKKGGCGFANAKQRPKKGWTWPDQFTLTYFWQPWVELSSAYE